MNTLFHNVDTYARDFFAIFGVPMDEYELHKFSTDQAGNQDDVGLADIEYICRTRHTIVGLGSIHYSKKTGIVYHHEEEIMLPLATLWTEMQSSVIKRMRYYVTDQTLEIVFATTGESHCYYRVPWSVYQGLVNAPSAGRYFNENIRGKYRSVKGGYDGQQS